MRDWNRRGCGSALRAHGSALKKAGPATVRSLRPRGVGSVETCRRLRPCSVLARAEAPGSPRRERGDTASGGSARIREQLAQVPLAENDDIIGQSLRIVPTTRSAKSKREASHSGRSGLKLSRTAAPPQGDLPPLACRLQWSPRGAGRPPDCARGRARWPGQARFPHRPASS